jgi:zinc transport system permease protein
MTFSEMFNDPMITTIIIKAVIVGFLVSLCSSLLGVSLVLKRYSMIGDGLSHFGFFAVAIATVTHVFGNFSLEFEMLVVVAVAVILLRLNGNSKTKGDAAIAIFSTAGIALGSIIYNATGNNTMDVCTSLFGSTNIFTISDVDMAFSVIVSVIVLVMFIVFYAKIFAVTFDSDFAKATGTKVNVYNTMIAILTAVIIVLGMKMMGAIMISGLIIFPALSSMRVCKSFKGVVILSGVMSVVCFLIGFFIACRYSFQTGPTVVTIDVFVFTVFLIISKFTSKRKKAEE